MLQEVPNALSAEEVVIETTETLSESYTGPKETVSYDKPNENKDKTSAKRIAPDGGWGWVVCFSSMLINGIVFGIVNSFGIIYVRMVKEHEHNVPNIGFKTCEYTFYTCALNIP